MTTYYEESGRQYVDKEIKNIIEKYSGECDGTTLLNDLITYCHLLLHTKKVQEKLLSNCKDIGFDIFNPNNIESLNSMQRLSSTVRVAKIAKISLTSFFSVEANLIFTAVDGSDVYVNISFLRNEDVLKSGKWQIIDYCIHCGQDQDNMFTLLKLSFSYNGKKESSGCYGFEIENEEGRSDEPDVDEADDDLPINAEFSDGYVSDESEMSEEDEATASTALRDKEEEKEEEELIKFEVKDDILQTLVELVNPQMPSDVFLMYLVSLEFWETNWNIDERFFDLMVDRPVFLNTQK